MADTRSDPPPTITTAPPPSTANAGASNQVIHRHNSSTNAAAESSSHDHRHQHQHTQHSHDHQDHDHDHDQGHSHGIMAVFKLSKSRRLMIIIGISFCFFVAEISVGFYTSSLALIADAFHYLNDLISFVVALVALKISERPNSPDSLTFGWQRSNLLGAFFNGVFMVALGVSIFLQALERFIDVKEVQNPKLVLIVGCVGLTLNIISALFLHEHDHSHGSSPEATDASAMLAENLHSSHRHASSGPSGCKDKKASGGHSHGGHSHGDLGTMGVLLHLIGDAINNIGVIIAALVIWKASYPGRFYADPGVSMGISLMILLGSIPLVKNSGSILMQSLPRGVNIEDIRHDMESVDGVVSVHELHVWLLDQTKAIASAHVVMAEDKTLQDFIRCAELIGQCLHAYDIHSVTLQPELPGGISRGSSMGDEGVDVTGGVVVAPEGLRARNVAVNSICNINCGTSCETLTCCGSSWKDKE